jgi:hypothetical protein
VATELPLILSGPILRRVEKNFVSVWVALKQSCTVKLRLWENQIKASDAKDDNIWFSGPDSGAKTVRLGQQLHVVVVAVTLPEGKKLEPERLYSYDLEIVADGQSTKETFSTQKLLKNDPPNVDPDGDHAKVLALGYDEDMLPCVVLPPLELEDLKVVHGSCRDTDNDFPDGLAWLDDLLSNDKAYTSALKRPHQLFLTGDQIYADEVPRPLLHMLSNFSKEIFGTEIEQLPLIDKSAASKVSSFDANVLNFPIGHRHNLILNEAGMTTTAGESHLMSFAEFCAMYLYVWSNVGWGDFPAGGVPEKADDFKLPQNWDTQVPAVVRDAITKKSNGEVADLKEDDYTDDVYKRDLARLTEFHRTLPKVRRALANVPTYTIFDDHEITDDWYLTATWRDRVLGSPLGSAIIRNGMAAYALFQGWGNDPVKFQPRIGVTEKQPHEQLLEQIPQFMPSRGLSGPDTAAGKIETLLGLDLRNDIALDGSYAETNPPLKWTYVVPGEKHQVLVLDCRTRRAFASRTSPPGNIGLTAQAEQIPEKPDPPDKKVWLVVSSLVVLGPPIFDDLFGPLLFRVFDAKDAGDLQQDRGTKGLPGTNPDAVEAWCFDSKLFEALLKRLAPYSPVLLLSGDVHYSATNALSYWYKKNKTDAKVLEEPARIVQFIASGLKNVMPDTIVLANRSFSILQKMIRAKIGAEKLAWENNSPIPMQLPSGSDVSPRLRGLLRKSPVLVPTIGWRGATTARDPDWAWRVCPVRDERDEKDRPKMAQPVSLFPDDPAKTNQDIGDTAGRVEYQRIAERHSRQLDHLNNSRQILFASSLAVLTFQNRHDPDKNLDVLYAIQDLYTIQRDPQDLVAKPKPLVYTRHEAPLRDLWQKMPEIKAES